MVAWTTNWIDSTTSTATTDAATFYYYPQTYYVQQPPAPGPSAEEITKSFIKPKPEGVLEWLDRRVDEVRMPLAA